MAWYHRSQKINSEYDDDIREFNWMERRPLNPNWSAVKFRFRSIIQVPDETLRERKKRMLAELYSTCITCSMCELGVTKAQSGNEIRDPHVFSNMNPSRILIYGQNPGWNEVCEGEPFIGAAGSNFNTEIAKYGLDRTSFYIANVVRCFTQGNKKPLKATLDRCSPFVQIEINLMRPLFVVTLGALAFEEFCPELNYADSVGTIVRSSKYGIKVFPVYHPSPLNFRDKGRKQLYEHQIKLLCKMVIELKKTDDCIPY